MKATKAFYNRLIYKSSGETDGTMAIEPSGTDPELETATPTSSSGMTVKKKGKLKKGKIEVEQPVSESSIEIPKKKIKTSSSKNENSSQSIQYSDEGSLHSSKEKLKIKKSKPSSESSSKEPSTPIKEKKGSLASHLHQEKTKATPKAGTRSGISVVSAVSEATGQSKVVKKTKTKSLTPAQTPESTPVGAKKKLIAMHDSASTLMTSASDGNSSKMETMWKPIMHDDVFVSPKKEARMKAMAMARADSAPLMGKQDDKTATKTNSTSRVPKSPVRKESKSPKRQGSKTKASKVPTSKTPASSSATDSSRVQKESLSSAQATSIRLPEIPDLVSESSASPTKNRRPRPSNPTEKLSSSDTTPSTTSLTDTPKTRSSTTIVPNPPVRRSANDFVKIQPGPASPRNSITKASVSSTPTTTTTPATTAPTTSKRPNKEEAPRRRRVVSNSPPRTRKATKNPVQETVVDSQQRQTLTERPSSLKTIRSLEEQDLPPPRILEPRQKLPKRRAATKNNNNNNNNKEEDDSEEVILPPRIIQATPMNLQNDMTRSESVASSSGTLSDSVNLESVTPPSSARESKKEPKKAMKESRSSLTEEEQSPVPPAKESIEKKGKSPVPSAKESIEKKGKKSTGKPSSTRTATSAEEEELPPMQESQSGPTVPPQRKLSKSKKRDRNNKENGESSTPRRAPKKELTVEAESLPSLLPLDSDMATEETLTDRDNSNKKKDSKESAKASKEARRERTKSPVPDSSQQGDHAEDKKGKKSKGKQSTSTKTNGKAKDDDNEQQEQAPAESQPQAKVAKSKKKSKTKDAGEDKSWGDDDSNDESAPRPAIMLSGSGTENDDDDDDDDGEAVKESRGTRKAREKSPRREQRATTPVPQASAVESKDDKKEKKSKDKQATTKTKDDEAEQVVESQAQPESQPQEKISKTKKKLQTKDSGEVNLSPPSDDNETTAKSELLISRSRSESDMATVQDESSPSKGVQEKDSSNSIQTQTEARSKLESTSAMVPELSRGDSMDDIKEKKMKGKQTSKAKDNEEGKVLDSPSHVDIQPPEKASILPKQSSTTINTDDRVNSRNLSQNNYMPPRSSPRQGLHGDKGDTTSNVPLPDLLSKNESGSALQAPKEDPPATESKNTEPAESLKNETVTEQAPNKRTAENDRANRIETDSKPLAAAQVQSKDSKTYQEEQKEALDNGNNDSTAFPGPSASNKTTPPVETTMVVESPKVVGIVAANGNPSDRNERKDVKMQEEVSSEVVSPSTSSESSNKIEPAERKAVTIRDHKEGTKGEERSSPERPLFTKQGSNVGATGQSSLEQEKSNPISVAAPFSGRSSTPSPKTAEKSSILARVRPQLARAETTIVRSNTPSPKPGGKPSVLQRQRQSFSSYGGTPRTSPKPNGTEGPSPKTPLQREDKFNFVAMSPPFRDSATADDLMPFITPKRTSNIRNDSQFASSKNALIEALTTPVRKQREVLASIDRTPRTLKRGFVEMNQKSTRNSEAKTPGVRVMDSSHHGKDKARTYIDAALDMLDDDKKVDEVENLVRKIESLGGFPKTRRLSLRDNELVGQLVMAVRNDPKITSVHVDASMFGTISSTLLSQFIDSLRINLHVKSLSFHGLELGNDFLYDLVASMEYNFVVEEIDLSKNCFTSEGLATFCQALALTNESVKKVNLKNQTTPISEASQVDVLEALEQNKALTTIELDFISDDGQEKLDKILERNRALGPQQPVNAGEKLINVLTFEAEKAQEVWDQQQAELHILDDEDYDWDYFYELALLFDKHKLKKEVEENAMEFSGPPKRKNADDLSAEEKKKFLFGEFKKNMEESVMAFNEDGSFLTPEFIAKFFKERPEEGALDFDFHGQWKLFRRFPVHDPARQTIVDKFIDAIVTHPRASELTGINMANTGAGDDFLIALSKRCMADPSLLPNLHTVNFETNFINEPGVVALANLVASPTSCKYMQVIRLENQKGLLKSKAEFALAKALRVNRSIVVLSLTVRNLLERERIGKYIMRNVDLIRQARQEYMKARGLQRKRNKVERIFDSVKENNEELVKIDMKGNERFLTLTKEEKIKAAQAFSHNTHVKELLLDGCGIDDVFAQALGEAIVTNTALQKVSMEGNDISGEGIKALFKGLGKNHGIKELRLHKQSKLLATSDEEILPDFLEENTTITKIGMDLRSKMAQIKLDQKTRQNISLELKEKAAAKGEESADVGNVYMIKF